jgi:hypothetical protein
MFTKVVSRVGRVAALGLIVGTIGLGFIGTGVAHGQDNSDGAGASCFYGGVEYSDGAVVRQADGALYRCKDGSWVFSCGGCVTGGSAVLTTDTGPQNPKAGVLSQLGGIQKLQMAR